MNKLILATSMIGFALGIPQAQAGSPMMDDPMPLRVDGETSHCRKNCVSAETGSQQVEPRHHPIRIFGMQHVRRSR